MARNVNNRKRNNKNLPFWETGRNPITMKKEESYAVVKEKNYDNTSKTRV
jgi:hypothetical protein